MNNPAQRLWVLERDEPPSSSAGTNVCRFVGAIAVLGDAAIYVVLVRSSDLHRANEGLLRMIRRLDLARDAFTFATLDDAVAWTEAMKQTWLRRGWSEVLAESDEGQASHLPMSHKRTT